jgi:hypothetical protein
VKKLLSYDDVPINKILDRIQLNERERTMSTGSKNLKQDVLKNLSIDTYDYDENQLLSQNAEFSLHVAWTATIQLVLVYFVFYQFF